MLPRSVTVKKEWEEVELIDCSLDDTIREACLTEEKGLRVKLHRNIREPNVVWSLKRR